MTQEQENIITYLDLQHLSNQEKVEVADRVSEALNMRVLNRAYEVLSEEQSQELDRLLDNENAEKIFQYLYDKVPNVQEIINTELDEIKQALREEVDNLQEKNAQKIEQEIENEEGDE